MIRRMLLLGFVAALALPGVAGARSAIVRDGHARFAVLTPTLIRMEYAQDDAFQDGATQLATRARLAVPRYRTSVKSGWRVIRTSGMTLRYRRGSGAFTAQNLRVRFAGRTARPVPGGDTQPLGGWTRALDVVSDPVPLNPGILSRDGWHVVDDTETALTKDDVQTARPTHDGPYQDWYLFAYGDRYAKALGDLRALAGPAPLLDRSAFGVWFSKYYPYSADELKQLREDFRAHEVPLDTLSVDTDYKRVANAAGAAIEATVNGTPGRPASWNGWDWNRDVFPDPDAFFDWARGEGLNLVFNIHPSINTNDPQYAQTGAKGGELRTDNGICRILQADPTGECKTFDWTKPDQLAAYFDLHAPFAKADMFWLDWCCEGEGSASAPGLTPDTWINEQYARYQRARGKRWPAFSRIGAGYRGDGVNGDRDVVGNGALAEHRSTIHFTGDTCASWQMLAFEAEMTAAEGAAIGFPYVSHDIGSFNGERVNGVCNGITAGQHNVVPDDMYARWVQFATFQPLDRLHSNHGKRLPWEYGSAAEQAASDALRLREALVPYTYTLARRAHDTGLPMAGPLYLSWPRQAAAYEHATEFTYGRDLVVAPVTAPGNPASVTYWVPPGQWIDLFTGERMKGPATRTDSVPLDRIPVLVRAGAVIPTQPPVDHTAAAPPARLILTVYPGSRGGTTLYDDAGTGFAHERGAFTRTRIRQRRTAKRVTLTVGRPRGRRTWEVRLVGLARPRAVRVNGKRAAFTHADGTVTVQAKGRARIVVTR